MLPKTRVTAAMYLIFAAASCEGFFLSASVRKQMPQTTPYNGHQWMQASATGNNGAGNGGQPGYGNYNDYASYQQQPQPQPQQQQQQQPQQQQQYYQAQLQKAQMTGPTKYEPIPHQQQNQQQYAYESGYGSYPQNVQLIPCLCPVNKEIMDQQNQQFQQSQPQQQQQQALPTSTSYQGENVNGGASSSVQGNQKVNS